MPPRLPRSLLLLVLAVALVACGGQGQDLPPPPESAETPGPLEGSELPEALDDLDRDDLDLDGPVPPGPTEVPDRVRYVALGDSIAAGSAATTSYVDEYARWFEDETGATVAVTNAAVPGWTSRDLLVAVREDEQLRAELAAAHLVTFNIGGNDLLAGLRALRDGRCGDEAGWACLEEAVAELVGAWEELLGELVALTGGEVDGLRTMDLYRPHAHTVARPLEATLERYLADVNDHLVDTAEAAGIEVARVHDAFGSTDPDGGLLADDGIHPNAHGHGLIADELAELGTTLNDRG